MLLLITARFTILDIVAMAVYAVVGYGIAKLFTLGNPNPAAV